VNILQLTLDTAVLDEANTLGSEARRRQLGYVEELRRRVPGSHLFIVVRCAPGMGGAGRSIVLAEGLELCAAPSSPLGFISAAYRYGCALSRQYGLDLVTSQTPFVDGLAAWLLRSRCNMKWLAQMVMSCLDNPYWLAENRANYARAWLGKLVLPRGDAVRVMSAGVGDWVHRSLGVPQERIFVLPVGTALVAEPVPVPGAQATSGDVLYVGRLSREKGVSSLLQAFQYIQNTLPTTQDRGPTLVIVGDGPERSNLEKLAATLGLQGKVRFAGMVPHEQLPSFFASAGAVVVPSLHESYGRVIVEAMAFGRAVVATDTDGARDLIRDGETGLIVPIQDAAALADKIGYLLSNPQVAHRMGEAAREFVMRTQNPQALRRAQVDMWLAIVRGETA
jgi:glycosyltransferase involved in cell wall biosynthesis